MKKVCIFNNYCTLREHRYKASVFSDKHLYNSKIHKGSLVDGNSSQNINEFEDNKMNIFKEQNNDFQNIEYPLVSIIVATYRRRETLHAALQSINFQTYKNIEIIIVDDNDDDEWNLTVKTIVESIDFCEEYSVKVLTNHPNLGSAKTRNIGINSAKGQYICFLDDDDLYLPKRIENQVECMIRNNADYSITKLALFNDNNTVSEYRNREYLKTEEKDDLILCHLKYHMTGTDTMMFKREYLISIGGFDPIDIGDEFYLMMKAIKGNGTFFFVDKCDVKAFVHKEEGGLSSGVRKIQGEEALFQYKKRYFDKLSTKDIKYITMRHYAVLAFAGLRMNDYRTTLKNGFKCICVSPKECIKIITHRK